MDLGALLTTVFGVTTVIAATLAALGYGVLRTLRESNGDLRARVSDLEKDRSERDARIAELTGLYETARQIATGEVHWQALVDLMAEHQVDAKAHWRRELEMLAVLGEARTHWAREVELLESLVARWDDRTRKAP
jgi:hypothetical protein